MFASAIQRLGVALLLAPLATASTWIVDDDGGVGVNFTSITAAVAAAGPGDVILVRAGSYAGFTLTYGASILGDPGAVVTSAITLSGLPAAPRATLAGLELRTLRIVACAAPVTLEDVLVQPLDADLGATIVGMVFVDQSADVRLRNVTVIHPGTGGEPAYGVWAQSSRVEIVDSWLEGKDGRKCGFFFPGPPQSGRDALAGANAANLHVARTTLIGGSGGHSWEVECGGAQGGFGKAGLWLGPGSSALVSGLPSDVFQGGKQGEGNDCGQDGEPGNGIVVDAGAALRLSGVTAIGESYFPGCGGTVPPIVGSFTQASPDDPTLSFTGTQLPGQILKFTVTGAPGDTAALLLGRKLSVTDVVNVVEDQLLQPLRTFQLGTLPASGTASFSIPVPSNWVAGQMIVAQGRTTAPSGAVSLTHSLPVTIR